MKDSRQLSAKAAGKKSLSTSARQKSHFNPPKKLVLKDSTGQKLNLAPSETNNEGLRLQKVLANAGFGSRRSSESLIAAGRVSVNGQKVLMQGMRVNVETDVIHVDGRRIQLDDTKLTVVLNKPRKVVSAMSDPQGRQTLKEFADKYPQRLYHVGRLDYDTEGLILLSNDGELSHRLTHPSFEVSKTYICRFEVGPTFPRQLIKKLKNPIQLADGPAQADKAHLIAHDGKEAIVQITIHEGRNRIVRRMFEALGYELNSLVRTRIGPVLLGELKTGESRKLTAKELGTLMAEVGL